MAELVIFGLSLCRILGRGKDDLFAFHHPCQLIHLQSLQQALSFLSLFIAPLQELSIRSSFLHLPLTLRPTLIWPLAAPMTLVQLFVFHPCVSNHLLPT